MIHAPRDIVALWNSAGALRRVGNVILTINDSIVVSGAGYPGSGPSPDNIADGEARSDGSAWVYGSGFITTRRSPDIEWSGDDSQIVERSQNSLILKGQQLVAATFDPCCTLTVELDVPMPAQRTVGS